MTWLPAVGFEGFYEVSDEGQVRSVDRVIWTKSGVRRHYKGKILRPGGGTKRHRHVRLGKGGVRYIHRLVLEAFVGPCPPGHECCHRDDNRENNYLTNLRWDTRSENALDQVRNGIHKNGSRILAKCGHPLVPVGNRRRCSECTKKNNREYIRQKRVSAQV